MKLYYMTSRCPDVDIDRKILRSGVRVDRKLLQLVRIVYSDVDIDLTMSHPCQTRVLMYLTSRGRRADVDIDRECCRYIQGSYIQGFLIVSLNSRYVTWRVI